MWEIEKVPYYNCLWVRIHQNLISSKDTFPKASAFSNTPRDGDNLSADWCKYASANSAKELINKQIKANGMFKNSNEFKMWEFNVGDISEKLIPKQTVEHEPIFYNPEVQGKPNNRAHSKIIGDKPENSAEFRINLLKIGRWAA
jgi:hypothetical protein